MVDPTGKEVKGPVSITKQNFRCNGDRGMYYFVFSKGYFDLCIEMRLGVRHGRWGDWR